MFERLYGSLLRIFRNKVFAFIVAVVSVGGATVVPFITDRMVDGYDELKFKYINQREKIRLLEFENDSLREAIRRQSIEFTKMLYNTNEEFGKRIHKMDSVFITMPARVAIHKTDKPKPSPKLSKPQTIIDSAKIARNQQSIKESGTTISSTDKPVEKKSIFMRLKKKKKTN